MLNKLKFNNLVISNKKGIQQSRIQTINKLVHKIRKLKTLLEKRPKDDKCKERIRKSTESMDLLKKFKRVEIMKHVLLLEKPPAAVITNGMSTPEEIAVALLVMNKVMQGLIKRFKSELELMDSGNRTWREELKENSKRRQKIERTEQKKLKRKVIKEQKIMEHKRKEWMEQNYEHTATTLDGEDNISTAGSWKVEEINTGNSSEEKQIMNTEPELKILSKVQKIKKESSGTRDSKIKPNIEPKKEKLKNPISTKTKIKNENAPKTTTTFEHQSLEDDKGLEENGVASESDDADSPAGTLVEDPFFFTDTGESYLSTAVARKNKTQQDLDDENQKNLHMVKLNGSKKYSHFQEKKHEQGDRRAQHKENKWTNNDAKSTWKRNIDRNEITHNSKKPWQTRIDNNKLKNYSDSLFSKNGQVNTKQLDEKLHPSWAAKQKLKPVITSFQGKKIKFDEDGSSRDTAKNTFSQSTVKINNKDPSVSSKESADAIHPSWAAKQKLKPVIAAFQGKKITFDNDD